MSRCELSWADDEYNMEHFKNDSNALDHILISKEARLQHKDNVLFL